MKLKLIKSEKEYQKALKVIDKLFHAEKGTEENDELEILLMLVEKYENEKVGEFPNPDTVEAIKFKMEQMGLVQKDFARIVGLKSRASEILARERSMSINIIRKISNAFYIPAEILIQPYQIVGNKN